MALGSHAVLQRVSAFVIGAGQTGRAIRRGCGILAAAATVSGMPETQAISRTASALKAGTTDGQHCRAVYAGLLGRETGAVAVSAVSVSKTAHMHGAGRKRLPAVGGVSLPTVKSQTTARNGSGNEAAVATEAVLLFGFGIGQASLGRSGQPSTRREGPRGLSEGRLFLTSAIWSDLKGRTTRPIGRHRRAATSGTVTSCTSRTMRAATEN